MHIGHTNGMETILILQEDKKTSALISWRYQQGELLNMSDADIKELRTVAGDLGITITSNIGPPKDKDVASKGPCCTGSRNQILVRHHGCHG